MTSERSILTIACVLSLLPAAVLAQAFWNGVDLADTGMSGEEMKAIHEIIQTGMQDLAPTPTGFPTGDMLPDDQRGLRIYETGQAWDGYTLLNCFTGTGTEKNGNNVLIDMKGAIVNEWLFPGAGYLSAAKPLPGGCIAGSSVDPEAMMPGGGKVTQLDWEGKVVKQWDTNMHHDHEREGSPCGYYVPGAEPMVEGGKVLVLESIHPSLDETKHICSSKPIKTDMIRELDWDGNELFRWECWRHFDDLGMDEWAQAGIDLGRNYEGPDFMADMLPEDWSHGNAVAWCGPNRWYDQGDLRFDPENIIADFRSLNTTVIIARHAHPEGRWDEGDIVWRLGPDYSTASDDYKVGQIIGQHMAHMIPRGLPGEGNLLLFDNGGAAGYGALVEGMRDADGNALGSWPNKFRMYSRVLEINPVTKQIVWEFKQPRLSEDLNGDGMILGNEKLFFSNLMSGAQRLPNGNTLITEADVGRVFEVTPGGDVTWEYAPTWFDPEGFMGVAVYRSYRIPYAWVPLTESMAQTLKNRVPITGLYGGRGRERLFKVEVPNDADVLSLGTYGGTGNCDVYIRRGAMPTTTDADYVSTQAGNDDGVSISPAPAGTWYLLVRGEEAYDGVNVEAEFWSETDMQ